ncbi:Tfp pilus assembly protein PilN [Paraburkholderia piptadeniae]|uniref:Tfp pilus assembly protein PilN n=1 Tax=Paraburkholderia piptadeniae TaxID=1701573 RepID=A0A1N7SBZ0_9BURK|nr:fimbrial assembly protein [Paraburkholderia piptadeniae]SIT44843.1 Tfp pilus assembly protein PilN [Paraburkholderia piptadeniae]
MTAVRIKAGGFNLLPHRQRDARLARRRRYVEWTAAALCGCVAVAMLVGWQAFERTSIDRQRAVLDRKLATLASPLAEHARLTGEASNERLQNERAATLSEPLVHLLDLLDALSREPSEAVVVKQLMQRGRDTEMLAVSTDHAAASAWLNRLAALRGVKDASLSDLHRTASATDSSAAIELTANLKWDGPPEKPKASAAAHQKTRGEK